MLRLLNGRPWVVLAAEALLRRTDAMAATLIVAAPNSVHAEVRDVVEDAFARAVTPTLVESGPTLHGSLHSALDAVRSQPGTDRCVVHDVCRPLVTEELVSAVLDAARSDPAAAIVPTLPLVETVKSVGPDGRIVRTLDRTGMVRVQTPQAAPLAVIRAAHRACESPFGERPNLVGDATSTVVVPGEDRAEAIASGRDGDVLAAAWRS